jgi:hypothetical protein
LTLGGAVMGLASAALEFWVRYGASLENTSLASRIEVERHGQPCAQRDVIASHNLKPVPGLSGAAYLVFPK